MATFQIEAEDQPHVGHKEEERSLSANPFAKMLGQACLIASIPYLLFSIAAALWVHGSNNPTLPQIITFSYLSPQLLAAANGGSAPAAVFFGDITMLFALSCLYAAILLIISISALMPFYRKSPFMMQASITSFFVAYIVTLLIFDTINFDVTLIFAVVRFVWIVLLFALAERLKLSYRTTWVGGGYFPTLIDGLFAIGASLMLAVQLDERYDAAFSGPVFLLVAFLAMTVINSRYARAQMRKALLKRVQFEPDEGTKRSLGKTTFAVSKAFWDRYAYLKKRTHEELEAEYKLMVAEATAASYQFFTAETHRKLVILVGIVMVIWGLAVAFALWLALNFWLAILPH